METAELFPGIDLEAVHEQRTRIGGVIHDSKTFAYSCVKALEAKEAYDNGEISREEMLLWQEASEIYQKISSLSKERREKERHEKQRLGIETEEDKLSKRWAELKTKYGEGGGHEPKT